VNARRGGGEEMYIKVNDPKVRFYLVAIVLLIIYGFGILVPLLNKL
jgi:hypothetical protein